MTELPFVFCAGILGTAHCIGMCGPMILTIGGSAPTLANSLTRQLCYSVGRIFSYTALGIVAGYCGARLAAYAPALINVPAILAIVVGLLFIYQGLQSAGVLRWLQQRFRPGSATSSSACKRRQSGGCTSAGLLKPFLQGNGRVGALIAGVFTGFLPCGLLYGMLALAASSHSPLHGGATMLTFGLGTMPLLVLTGVSGQWLSAATRQKMYVVAAWLLLATGVVSIVRGASHISYGERPAAGCPFCAAEQK